MQKFILNNRLGARIHRQEWQPGKEQAQKRMKEKPQKESNERQLTTTRVDRLQGTV